MTKDTLQVKEAIQKNILFASGKSSDWKKYIICILTSLGSKLKNK